MKYRVLVRTVDQMREGNRYLESEELRVVEFEDVTLSIVHGALVVNTAPTDSRPSWPTAVFAHGFWMRADEVPS